MPRLAKRRKLPIAVALVLVVVGIAGCSGHQERDGDQPADAAIAEAREAADPGCGPVLREPVDGAFAHIDDAPIHYTSAPPSFGDHRSRWEVRALNFYGVDDRPDVPVLVHNLEHGYNILWYDQTVLDDSDALARVEGIADGYAPVDRAHDPATAFIAVPWTAEDEGEFPDGMHYALTHWYADPTDRTRSRDDELGLTRYCSGLSAEVVQEWMNDYPLRDAPEGYPHLM